LYIRSPQRKFQQFQQSKFLKEVKFPAIHLDNNDMNIGSATRTTNITAHLLPSFIRLRQAMLEKHSAYPIFQADQQEIASACAFAGQALLTLPLIGTDGPRGKRSYHATPMDFRPDTAPLHQLGNLFAANPPLPYSEVARLIETRTECYKFEVRVPSPLLGFNLDSSKFPSTWRQDDGALAFEVFDGGRCFDDSTGELRQVAQFRFLISAGEPLKCRIDLIASNVSLHDIDCY
jgi:hypothetical protein